MTLDKKKNRKKPHRPTTTQQRVTRGAWSQKVRRMYKSATSPVHSLVPHIPHGLEFIASSLLQLISPPTHIHDACLKLPRYRAAPLGAPY